MRRKILSLILGAILCFSVFTGCSLIEHNDEKDMQQVVAVIDPITDTDQISKITYTSETKRIYKSELSSAMNQYASTYMSSYGLTAEQATDRILEELVTRELLIIEAERLLEQEKIEWTKQDENTVRKYVYSAIDSQIASIRNNVLTDFGETVGSADADSESTDTTYPVPDEETSGEDYSDYDLTADGKVQYENKQKKKRDENGNVVLDADGNPVLEDVMEEVLDGNGKVIMVNDEPLMRVAQTPKIKDWEPEKYSWPAMYGDEDEKSRDREAMRRLVVTVEDLVNDDFRVTDADKAKFEKDKERIDKVINEQGIEYVYPMLGETYIMEYLVGVSARESVLISKLQEYIVGKVTVDDKEIADAYNAQLTYQRENYENDQSAYQSAVAGGSITMLYLRDDSCFYVKHILIPFSDEQTAAFSAYKSDPKNAGKDFTAYRDNMVKAIVAYPHKDGENDLTRPMTVDQVFNHVKSEMSSLAASPMLAERKFDELTYLYNTDPGAFGTGKAYYVKRNDDTDHSGYMQEFYEGAMELYNEGYRNGQVLPHYVVTDYGVHIMYMAQRITAGVRELNDYLTPGEYATVRSTFESTIRSTKENAAFTEWQNNRITYYQERAGVVHTYKSRYESFYTES